MVRIFSKNGVDHFLEKVNQIKISGKILSTRCLIKKHTILLLSPIIPLFVNYTSTFSLHFLYFQIFSKSNQIKQTKRVPKKKNPLSPLFKKMKTDGGFDSTRQVPLLLLTFVAREISGKSSTHPFVPFVPLEKIERQRTNFSRSSLFLQRDEGSNIAPRWDARAT